MLKVTTTEYYKIQGVNIIESGSDVDGNKFYSMDVNATVYSDAEKTALIRTVSFQFTNIPAEELSLPNAYTFIASRFENVEPIL